MTTLHSTLRLRAPMLTVLAGVAGLALVASGCGNEIPVGTVTKEQAAATGGKNDRGQDLCELLEWYGDEVCDDFCPRPDPDCNVSCEAYPACDEGDVEDSTINDIGDCPADARCYQRSICGTTIWCVGGSRSSCQGPNPQGCTSDADCGAGQVCAEDPEGGCHPSACSCDGKTGGWICTADCGGRTCQPAATCLAFPTCDEGDTEVGSEGECLQDARCYQRTLCGSTIWCTGPGDGTCPGENPQGCSSDADCGAGQTCQTSDAECRPSGCACDAKTGAWTCTADCGGGVCVPSGECQSDADCGAGSYCAECRTTTGSANVCLREGTAC